jgi:polyhydroxyalkanoate synthesis regulator phasin
MGYPIEIKLAPKQGWFTPAESNAFYATKYDRLGVTIHWWGDGTGASNHDNIVNYMNNQAAQEVKSVNYVVSDAKITMCVSPENVAWCSGPKGNPVTVSIECQPTLGDEGYRRLGWLIAELERKFGRSLAIYGHRDWAATACPGSLDLTRIRWEANNAKVTVLEDEMIKTREEATVMYKLLRPNAGPSEDEINATVNRRTFARFLQDAGHELSMRDARLQAQANNITEMERAVAELRAHIENDKVTDATTLRNHQTRVAELTAEIDSYRRQMAALQAKVSKPVTTTSTVSPLPTAPKASLLVRILAILFAKKS